MVCFLDRRKCSDPVFAFQQHVPKTAEIKKIKSSSKTAESLCSSAFWNRIYLPFIVLWSINPTRSLLGHFNSRCNQLSLLWFRANPLQIRFAWLILLNPLLSMVSSVFVLCTGDLRYLYRTDLGVEMCRELLGDREKKFSYSPVCRLEGRSPGLKVSSLPEETNL